jgi:DNA-nicking Smr family endonuclease
MTTSKSSGKFRPFEELKALLKSKSLKLEPYSDEDEKVRPKTGDRLNDVSKTADSKVVKLSNEDERKIFLEAMSGVKPIPREDRVEHNTTINSTIGPDNNSEAETLLKLDNLIKFGQGFIVADTPEYIEGTGYNVNPEFAKRLHRGDFSIQAHIDLHGLCVEDARDAFEKFFKDSITTGKRGVLIVHGRGLSSPNKPVLKTKVVEWLTYGPWRKWVIAFSSARSCDGGAGATYVLLRRHPITKRHRKRNKHKI